MSPAVELLGDGAILGRVFEEVGVEQVKLDAADGKGPRAHQDGAAEDFHAHAQRRAVGVERFGDGQVGKVLVELQGHLLALAGDLLLEVAMPVEQADGDEVQAEVRGGLAVVASEDAEAAGVVRHGLVEAELGREIRHQRAGRGAGVAGAIGVAPGHVGLEAAVNLGHLAPEIVVLGELEKARLGGVLEHPQGRMVNALPERHVDVPEQLARGRLPAPPKVVNEVVQRREGRRKLGDDVESLERLHTAGVGKAGAPVPARGGECSGREGVGN